MNTGTFGRHIIVLAVTLGAFSAAPTSAQDTPPGPVALFQTVEIQSIRPAFEHPGRIEALDVAVVRPVLRAQITSIDITAGELVEKGDLLMEMDTTDYNIALAQARASLKQAQANALKAELDLERAEQLAKTDTVSQRQVELARTQADVANAQVEVAETQIEQAEENLRDTKVYAPFAGRISSPTYAVGDLYAPGDPTRPAAVAEIVSLDPIYAVGLVDQANYFNFIARQLQIQEAGRSIPPLELEVVLPGGHPYPHTGKFENWDNTAVSSTGTIAARILFPNPDGALLPGQNVTIRGQVYEEVNAPLVAQRAVGFDQQGHFVWVIGEGDAVERRNIEIGIRHKSSYTVFSGLEAGERVVVEGLQKMRPGTTVTPKPYEG